MSFNFIAQKGIDAIRKTNQQHQMPLSSFECFGPHWKKKNATYLVDWSVDRKEHIDFITKLSYTIDKTSKINVRCADPFVSLNLEQELKQLNNVEINSMAYDLPGGNPEFYRRSNNASNSQTGNVLVYDEHIYNAVNHKSGKFKENGPFIIDHAWFQGEAKQGKFRRWLYDVFGLKNIVILDPKEFDVDSGKTGICMIYGEDGYNGKINLHNLITGEKFDEDFRSIGYIIPRKDLSTLLPKIKTKTNYVWKRTGITLKLDKDEKVIKGPKEIKGGDVPVLKRLRLGQEPEYYYTTKDYVTDWTDSDKERFVTRYQPNTQAKDDSGNRLWYKIAVGTVVQPGTIIPGDMWFSYTVVDQNTGEDHKAHLMSDEVTKILKATRTGQSLHTPQTIWVPYATEFSGFTDDDRKIIDNL